MIRGFALEECPQCSFVQMPQEAIPQDLRSVYQKEYYHAGKYDHAFVQARENARRLRLLKSHQVPPGARILEAGCATGDFLQFVRPYFDLWGLDWSEHAVQESRRRMPELADRIALASVDCQEYPREFFDALVLWDVLEHLEQPGEVCQRLLTFLKPGGWLFLSTPDVGSLTARLLGRNWAFLTVPQHLGLFNRKSLRFLLEDKLKLTLKRVLPRGKWVSVSFLLHKMRKGRTPDDLTLQNHGTPFSRLAVYVPTRDILYVAAQKL